MKRALVLGAAGMLARDLVGRAPPDVDVVTKTRRDLDVTDEDAVRSAMAEVEPDVILNCAGYTSVDGAEAERDVALAVNGAAPGIIGRAAARFPLPASRFPPLVVHFSTDYVFDGNAGRPYREEDPPNPVNVYGASKLAGERALAESGASYVIIRTSWLFGPHGKSFARTMWQRASEGRPTQVVNDQVGRPTYTRDLAAAVWQLLEGKREAGSVVPDVLHVANAGQATWHDVAKHIFEAAGNPDLLSPCATADYPTPARRPPYSVLDTSRYEQLSGDPIPRWEDALARFIAELAG